MSPIRLLIWARRVERQIRGSRDRAALEFLRACVAGWNKYTGRAPIWAIRCSSDGGKNQPLMVET